MISLFFKYWFDVGKKSWSKTTDWLGVRGILLDFLISGAGIALYHCFIAKDKKWDLNELLAGIVVFLGLLIIVFLLFFIIEPAVQDEEKKEIINKRSGKELKVSIGVLC